MNGCKNRYISLLISTSALLCIAKDKNADLKVSIIYHRIFYPSVRGSEEAKIVLGPVAPRTRLQ